MLAKPDAGVFRKRRFHWLFVVGASFFALVILILILTPWLAPYDPNLIDLTNRLQPPSSEHLFGTDHLGRDVLSRIMFGGRFSVSIAVIVVLITGFSGTVLGALSARIGGTFDEVLMRTVDALLAFPEVLLALFLVFALGPGYGTLILALSLAGWTPFARLTRAVTLEVNSKDFIEAAQALGCSRTFIIFRHVLPNSIGPVLAQGFLRFGHALIAVGGPVVPRSWRSTAELGLGRNARRCAALHGSSTLARHFSGVLPSSSRLCPSFSPAMAFGSPAVPRRAGWIRRPHDLVPNDVARSWVSGRRAVSRCAGSGGIPAARGWKPRGRVRWAPAHC